MCSGVDDFGKLTLRVSPATPLEHMEIQQKNSNSMFDEWNPVKVWWGGEDLSTAKQLDPHDNINWLNKKKKKKSVKQPENIPTAQKMPLNGCSWEFISISEQEY